MACASRTGPGTAFRDEDPRRGGRRRPAGLGAAADRAADGDRERVVLLVAEEVDALYVLPGLQGSGIGRWLVQEAANRLAGLGFASLHVGVLTANLPARRFYEAMGGHEIGQRTFDEEGHLLPGTVYAWSDIAGLMRDPDDIRRSRRPGHD
jgi:GNAT superfamily N-acetyltransferase